MSWSLDNPVVKCHESSQWEKYKFDETNGDMLHQNTDTSKYIKWNNNKFYNSAVFLNNGTYYIFIIGTMYSYFELWYSSSEDGTYFKGISIPLRQYTGDTAYWYADGAYYDNRLDIKFTYVRQCDSFETVLPIYTDWDDFLDYIKAPYTPPPVIKASGGGGGLYGGYKGNILTVDGNAGGGAGSGYIGNSLLSNKKMVGYKVPTSSDASTKTESSNTFSTAAESNKPKAGNGFCRIKFIEACWAGEEVPILWAGDQNKMTVQLSANVLLFKLYTGSDVEYVFTANTGSSIDDTDDIYVHFLIDTNLQLAKPSMIYKDGSVYSYNLEDPTDEQMADIYTWIAPGLPS